MTETPQKTKTVTVDFSLDGMAEIVDWANKNPQFILLSMEIEMPTVYFRKTITAIFVPFLPSK